MFDSGTAFGDQQVAGLKGSGLFTPPTPSTMLPAMPRAPRTDVGGLV